jgi:hypothetical protein
MPQVEFEPTTPVFERARTVHAVEWKDGQGPTKSYRATDRQNDTVISEKWLGRKVEGSGRGLIENTMLVYSWREWGNHETPGPDSRPAGRYLNLGPPEYKAELLPTVKWRPTTAPARPWPQL